MPTIMRSSFIRVLFIAAGVRVPVLNRNWLCTKSRGFRSLSLRSRLRHKAWGGASFASATPGSVQQQRRQPVKTGDSTTIPDAAARLYD